ncbi:MAG: hypothetical protein EOO77_18145, partial [Oxalobacteraceae bacterium]
MAFTITGSVAAQQLAQALVGSGITVSNVTFTGDPTQAGTFSGGLAAGGVDQTGASGIGFDSGIVLSTGTATATADPQTSDRNDTSFNGSGDTALTTQTGDQTYDAAVLEFDFNPGNATQAFFNFVFGTDEYPDSPTFNDGFLILVNGVNVAKIPGDSSAVQLSNFNAQVNKQYYKDASVNDNPSGFPTQVINAQIESMSVVLQSSFAVMPNQTNHIKFAIADSGDSSVDSIVFVQGGSLSTTPVSTVSAPTLALFSDSDSGTPGDFLTNVATPVITGTGTAGNAILVYDGATQIGSTVVASDGTWSIIASTLTDGSHNLTATQTDSSSNISPASAPLALSIDTTAPDAPITPGLSVASDSGIHGDSITNVTTPTVTGTAEPGSTVMLYDTDGTTLLGAALADGSGAYSIVSSTLTEGTHSLTVKAADPAGNIGPASSAFNLSIDTTAPDAPSTAPALSVASDSGTQGDSITSVTTPTVTGNATPGSTVMLYDTDGTTLLGTALADGSGAYSIVSSTLTEGT